MFKSPALEQDATTRMQAAVVVESDSESSLCRPPYSSFFVSASAGDEEATSAL